MFARSTGATALLLIVGVAALALASRLVLPVTPVPITGQTLAVTVIGALYGSRLGAATVLTWLALAAGGVPLLAAGAAGITHFVGPTAGYLLAFPCAAALVGVLCAAGGPMRFAALVGVMALGNALCLAIGALWLAASAGVGAAIVNGILPFLPGAFAKSLAGAAIIWVMRRPTGSNAPTREPNRTNDPSPSA